MLFHHGGYCSGGLAGEQHFISPEHAKHKPRVQIKWNQSPVCGGEVGRKISPCVGVWSKFDREISWEWVARSDWVGQALPRCDTGPHCVFFARCQQKDKLGGSGGQTFREVGS